MIVVLLGTYRGKVSFHSLDKDLTYYWETSRPVEKAIKGIKMGNVYKLDADAFLNWTVSTKLVDLGRWNGKLNQPHK